MADSCGIARQFGLQSILHLSPRFNRFSKANLDLDNRFRRTIARSFAGSERVSHRELLAEATKSASIRFKDSLRSDSLLIDLYAGCLISSDHDLGDHGEFSPIPCHYTLASKFIDDQLLSYTRSAEEIKQIVLLSDGFDTRPYRIKWPPRTSIYDISVGSIFNNARQKLDGLGAKIMKTIRHVHVPLESPNIQMSLFDGGFDGGSPSSWVLQGFPVTSLEDVEEILSLVSSLAVKGSFFLGELPTLLVDAQTGNKISKEEWMDKIFTSNGFSVKTIDYEEVARKLQRTPPPKNHCNYLFIAEHIRFSDQQMEDWRREFLRIEDEGDEDGFEDMF